MLRSLAAGVRSGLRIAVFIASVLIASPLTRLSVWVASAMGPGARKRLGQAILHHYFRFAAWLFGLELRLQGPMPPRGSLIVANHHSYFDIVALSAATPCLFLSKAEVSRWPLIGPGAVAAGIAFVKRDSMRSRKAAMEAIHERLRSGFTLVNFPSGTTCRSDEALRFRPGLFNSVAGTAVTLAPVSLRYEDGAADWVGDATFLGHLIQLAGRPRLRVQVVFHPTLNAADFEGRELRARCEALVNDAHTSPWAD